MENKIAEVGVEVLTEPRNNDLNFLGSIKYGKILDDSECQDSDWDQIGEFSKSFSKVKGNTFDISGAIGNRQYTASKTSFATYYFGFDYNYSSFEQIGLDYKINRQENTFLPKKLGQLNPNTQLVSTYKYHNYAPWFGAKIHYKLNDKLSFSPFLKAYLFVYKAEADWKLRNDFRHDPSFKHTATGAGLSLDAEVRLVIKKRISKDWVTFFNEQCSLHIISLHIIHCTLFIAHCSLLIENSLQHFSQYLMGI